MRQKLRGLVAQGMNGRKGYADSRTSIVTVTDRYTGSGTVTTAYPCWALIYCWGGGAPGDGGGGTRGGGGGAGACYKRVRLSAGRSLAWSVGAAGVAGDGGDTTVVLPGGVTMRAGGGKFTTAPGTGTGGLGGVASGGDLNRAGGAGGVSNGAGAPGEFGGAGGATVSAGGGGGGAGFSDLGDLIGGAGSVGSNSPVAAGTPGGGGGGSVGPAAAGSGRVLILLVRVT